MSNLQRKGLLYVELYEALAHFISRQQLVARAVTDQEVALQDLARGVTGWHDKTAARGTWGDWQFAFHGGGCRLTNPLTQEVIDWNGPDPRSINSYFFLDHLDWRLQQHADLTHLAAFVAKHGLAEVKGLIDELTVEGIISADHHLAPQGIAAQTRAA